jgi:hypothetical protein
LIVGIQFLFEFSDALVGLLERTLHLHDEVAAISNVGFDLPPISELHARL